ncbi:glycosyltransferase family 2 protein [Prochlorococcus sp. MIT 1341]|uniref:glycosyltransferase family 2 protein n=1 Tax=Prochlorococcus sp. MIT 1341 TaxID=3096221 RepID=UPI002A74970D|nr:glycosyltransferase family 2 protein [Prochlorococcus sp. MIT 1341]
MIDTSSSETEKINEVWVVAACWNEEAVICQFIERVLLRPDVAGLVLVDDGSTDSTLERVRQWQKKSGDQKNVKKVVLIELTRNFGKEAAMLAGLDFAKDFSEAVVLIDSDLQHPPELIDEMVIAWRSGAEIVTAVRDDRDQESLFKITSAAWFYKIFNRLVDSVQLIEGAGDYRLLSAPVVEALTTMREFGRFSKGLVPWTGYRSFEISYKRVIRSGGVSSWSPIKLFSYALDGIFSFSVLPLKIWTFLGITVSFVSLIYALLVILRTIVQGIDVPGYASLIVAVLFLGGIQLIGIGVLGDYIGRVYVAARARPHYFIRHIYNID